MNISIPKLHWISLIICLLYFLPGEMGIQPIERDSTQTQETVSISRQDLADKIKGGWAGQVIGCTYGGPTEFKFNGTMIQDYTPIAWDDTRMLWYYTNAPGLYDDVYMDLTFVDVIEREGIDAPASSHAKAFANADYWLWHANQAARYNILHGMAPPATGHWQNNPHADDIDFQIEADFAGLMSPGMINTASKICDSVGHIMNYGDGWYGGVFIAAMYSLAFVQNDIPSIVTEALQSIPKESTFYQCIADVIRWHEQYPEDWRRTWFECEKKWSSDIGCPDGVFKPFNIDAKINAAYVVIGLLYGEGDYGKTLDISTRCGQDSDCNPASAGGILGTVLGYQNIPAYWKQGLNKVEDMDFKYTTISLNDAYQMSLKHAIENITSNGGSVDGEQIKISTQQPKPVALEQGFAGHFPVATLNIEPKSQVLDSQNPQYTFSLEGSGFMVRGMSRPVKDPENKETNYLPEIVVSVDGDQLESAQLPTSFTKRRHEITWQYGLPSASHEVTIKLINPDPLYEVWLQDVLIYDEKDHPAE